MHNKQQHNSLHGGRVGQNAWSFFNHFFSSLSGPVGPNLQSNLRQIKVCENHCQKTVWLEKKWIFAPNYFPTKS